MNMIHMLYTRRAIPVSLTISNKSYVLAFPLKTMAVKAQTIIHPQTQMHVTHHLAPYPHENELGIDIPLPHMDAEAYVHIPKSATVGDCYMIDRTLVDIIMYPFTKNVGLVIPLEIVEDNATELVLGSQLVEPNGNIDLFRRELNKSILK